MKTVPIVLRYGVPSTTAPINGSIIAESIPETVPIAVTKLLGFNPKKS